MSNQKWARIHWTCDRTVMVVSRSPVQCDSAMSRVSDFEHDRRIWTIWAGQQHTYLFSPPFKLVRKWKRESTAVILPHKVRVPLASAMSILVMTWQVYTPSSLGSTLEIIRSGPSKVYLWKRQKKKKKVIACEPGDPMSHFQRIGWKHNYFRIHLFFFTRRIISVCFIKWHLYLIGK